jgi:hypothetical protein
VIDYLAKEKFRCRRYDCTIICVRLIIQRKEPSSQMLIAFELFVSSISNTRSHGVN